jgi:uncharacterized damage-inducible protein DinB
MNVHQKEPNSHEYEKLYDDAVLRERRSTRLSQMTDGMLLDRLKTKMGELSRYWALHLILDHATHHRGQAVVYLRLNGIKPPEYRAG